MFMAHVVINNDMSLHPRIRIHIACWPMEEKRSHRCQDLVVGFVFCFSAYVVELCTFEHPGALALVRVLGKN